MSRHPYATEAYARALAHMGEAVDAPAWGTFLIARPTPDGGRDLAGPYPRTPLAPGADLAGGLEALASAGFISVALVPDPLVGPEVSALTAAFEVCRPFKTHAVIDRARGGFEPSKHHRDRIRRAQRRCRVEPVVLADWLGPWGELYAGLAARHGIAGAADFPGAHFQALAGMPAMTAFVARVEDEVAGMTLWFEHAGVAVSHLTAANALGYANGANYALNAAAIEHFAAAAVVDLGGAAGAADDPSDGLFQFKLGFANATVVAHLCGAILDRPRYAALAAGREATAFFPAYRG